MSIPSSFNRRGIGGALFSILLGHGAATQALTITPTFGSSITGDANAAAIESTINAAIAVYQSRFSDPANIKINFQAMTSGLGQSNTWLLNGSYASFRGLLAADATSASDATALASLPTGSANPIPGHSADNIYLSTAEYQALGGGSVTTPNGFDGTVSLNTLLTDIGSPGSSGQYSLLAVVEHEIDEVLGLGSGLGGSFLRPEDLFRYNSTHARTYTTAGDDAYFSIDGGATFLARLNQDAGGDYGDWWSSGGQTPQVQDAFGTSGSHPTLGNPEITALDVIGYNPVPLPATPWLLLAGLGGMMWQRNRHGRD